jgi:hypothetical protein
MPDTSFRVVYRRPDRGTHLVARLDYFQYEAEGSNYAGTIPRSRPEARQRQGARAGVDRVK